jgi:hypothetical protein
MTIAGGSPKGVHIAGAAALPAGAAHPQKHSASAAHTTIVAARPDVFMRLL